MKLFQHSGESKWGLTGLMNFVDFTVFNGSAAEFTNINAGGIDVPAGASVTATLTNAEVFAVAQLDGAAVMQAAPTAAEKDSVLKVMIASYSASLVGVTKVEALATAMAQDNTLQRSVALAALGLPRSGLA